MVVQPAIRGFLLIECSLFMGVLAALMPIMQQRLHQLNQFNHHLMKNERAMVDIFNTIQKSMGERNRSIHPQLCEASASTITVIYVCMKNEP